MSVRLPLLADNTHDDDDDAFQPTVSMSTTVSFGGVNRHTSGRGAEHKHLHKKGTHNPDGTPQYDHGKRRFDISARNLGLNESVFRPNTKAVDYADLEEAGPEKGPDKQEDVSRIQGILFVVASTLFFSLAAVVVKLNSSIPSVETGTLRSMYSLIFGGLLCYAVYGQKLLPFQAGGVIVVFLILRGFVDFLASNLFYFGCTQLGLGFATVILFTNPFWAALLGKVWLKEAYGLSDFLLACTAFSGVVLSAWPKLSGGMSGNLITILIVLPAPIFQAFTYCLIKRIAGQVHFMQMTVAYGLCGCVIGPSMLTYGIVADQPLVKPAPLETLERPQVMVLGLGVALLAIMAQVFLNLGCARIEASIAALIRTIDIPLALVFQYVIFKEEVEWVSIIGAAIVFGASMLGTILKQLAANKKEDRDEDAASKQEDSAEFVSEDGTKGDIEPCHMSGGGWGRP